MTDTFRELVGADGVSLGVEDGGLVIKTASTERARIDSLGSGTGLLSGLTSGSLTSAATVTITSDSDVSGAGDIVFQTGGVTQARFTPANGGEFRVGNVTNWDPGPDTGSPAGNVFPVKFLHQIGTPGTPTKQTNQAFVGWATYIERTQDDSAEAASYGVICSSAWGGFASPQTLPVVGFESDALIQGTVSVTNKVVALTGGVKIQNTAHADSAMHFYAAQTSVDPGATLTNRYAFYDEGVTGTRPTNVWSVYGKESIQTEKSLYVGVAGAQTSNLGVAMVTGPNVSGGASDIPSVVLRPGAGQVSPTLNIQTNGGLARIQMFGATGNIQLGNGASGGSGQGLLSMVTTTTPSGTPPPAGAYLYVDPADNKLKAKTSGGTVTVLTPTA